MYDDYKLKKLVEFFENLNKTTLKNYFYLEIIKIKNLILLENFLEYLQKESENKSVSSLIFFFGFISLIRIHNEEKHIKGFVNNIMKKFNLYCFKTSSVLFIS